MPDLVPSGDVIVWAGVVVVSAWVTMAFAGGLSAADARSMCAEHVIGAVLSGILMRPDVYY